MLSTLWAFPVIRELRLIARHEGPRVTGAPRSNNFVTSQSVNELIFTIMFKLTLKKNIHIQYSDSLFMGTFITPSMKQTWRHFRSKTSNVFTIIYDGLKN